MRLDSYFQVLGDSWKISEFPQLYCELLHQILGSLFGHLYMLKLVDLNTPMLHADSSYLISD